MARRIYYPLYSRSSVVEFEERPKVRQRNGWIEKTGALRVRFATLEAGENHKKLLTQMNPVECYKFYAKATKVLKGQSSQEEVFVHKNHDQQDAPTKKLLIERWERNGKKGFSIILLVLQGEQRERINVACSGEELAALADWMKELNTILRYKEAIRVEEEEGGNEPLPQPDDEVPVDDEELPDDIF
ncbi:hypothetical protein [Desulfurobacterium crinifex]